MKKFSEWKNKINESTTIEHTMNDLIERLRGLAPNFSEFATLIPSGSELRKEMVEEVNYYNSNIKLSFLGLYVDNINKLVDICVFISIKDKSKLVKSINCSKFKNNEHSNDQFYNKNNLFLKKSFFYSNIQISDRKSFVVI